MPPQRRYICSFCARPFSRSEHRARHERSHTIEKPFHCTQCDSSFVRRDLLQRHLRTVHAKDKVNNHQAHQKKQKEDLKEEDTGASTSTSTSTTTGISTPTTTGDDVLEEGTQFANVENIFQYNEHKIISLLTLSKKFDLQIHPHSPTKISSLFLTWATIANTKLPIIQNDQLINLSHDSNLLYSILAFGAIHSNNSKDAIHYINEAWYSIHKNQPCCTEIIQSLTIISYIYLSHYQQLKKIQDSLIPIEIIMTSLDQTMTKLLTETSTKTSPLFNYWHVFNILAKFSFKYNKSPSESHSIFLTKSLASKSSLSQTLQSLSTTYLYFPLDEFDQKIVISALANEIQSLKFNNLNEYSSREVLHNSIIMVNKAFRNVTATTSPSPTTQENTPSLASDSQSHLIQISKRSLLLNCPLKFQDLLTDYITPPFSSTHWLLLQITLREFNMEYNPTSLTNITNQQSGQAIITLHNYLNNLRIGKIVNNLGITSVVVLFLGFLNLDPVTMGIEEDNNEGVDDLKGFIVENFMVLINVLEGIKNGARELEWENPVVQSLVYLIKEMSITDGGLDDGSNKNSGRLNGVENGFGVNESLEGHATPMFLGYLKSNILINFTNWLKILKCDPNWIQDIISGLQDDEVVSPLGSPRSNSESQSNNKPEINISGVPPATTASTTINFNNSARDPSYSYSFNQNYTSPQFEHSSVPMTSSAHTSFNPHQVRERSISSISSTSSSHLGHSNNGHMNQEQERIKLPPINVLKHGVNTSRILLPDRFNW